MTPYWADADVTLYLGDCLEVLAEMAAASVHAVVTDPPAAISFMGMDWDRNLGSRDAWIEWLAVRLAEALRVLKPGGHALVWALPRTAGWTQIALEDAGFEVRDCIGHMFGSGFPKSRNVARDIDQLLGAEPEVVGEGARYGRGAHSNRSRVEHGYRATEVAPEGGTALVTAPTTDEAAQWAGWGTALKPGHELWWLARKPFTATVAANVLEHGTGALNIDACRVEAAGRPLIASSNERSQGVFGDGVNGSRNVGTTDEGRWPPNVLLTHSAACGAQPNGPLHGDSEVEVWGCAPDCPVAELDRQSGALTSGANPTRRGSDKFRDAYGEFAGQPDCTPHRGADSGGASRFFPRFSYGPHDLVFFPSVFRYEPKAPGHERPRGDDGTAHPTVKPVDLMSWLVRLVTPPGGTVLDPFAGSGTTAEACIVEGFRSVLIEKDPAYCELIRKRLSKPIQPVMFGEGA